MKWYYQLLGWAVAIFFLVGSLFGPHVYYNHDDPHYYSQESSRTRCKMLGPTRPVTIVRPTIAGIFNHLFWNKEKEFFIIL